MRHLKHTAKLGRTSEHRNAMLANLVCSLIKHKRVTTTLAKAKAARPVAEKIITLGKRDTLQARRLVTARLRTHGPTIQLTKDERRKWRQNEDVLRILFEEIAPAFKERNGGYTRIVKMEQRTGDAAQRAILEWVDYTPATPESAETAPAGESKPTETGPAETKPAETKTGKK
ncbi:MAG TPA: 50S ribosomal protein L17 [Verrucomicrobiae bacterium]|nr:50S ribosomal protein L17 [Verrucomicrobiae bacterium]